MFEDWNTFDSLENIREWFGNLMKGEEAPPIFELAHPRKLAPTEHLMETLGDDRVFSTALRRRADSGTLEVSIPRRATARPDLDFLWEAEESDEGLLQRLAQSEDEKRTLRRIETTSSFVTAQFRSQLDDVGTQVIGPGGRVTVREAVSGSRADIVIRKRIGTQGSAWVDPREIVPSGDLVERSPKPVRFRATFGHFELSKFECQEHLRPALLIVAESEEEESELGGWRYAMVRPATSSEDLPRHAGLGSWV
jgi:hypothetical protein